MGIFFAPLSFYILKNGFTLLFQQTLLLMRQRDLNSQQTYRGILSHFDNHPDVWKGIEPIEESITYIRPRVAGMETAGRTQQEKDGAPLTTVKNAAMETMQRLAYKMAVRLKIYARRIGDGVLLQRVDFSKSEMDDGPEQTVFDRCVLIAEAAAAAQATPDAAVCKITLAAVAELNAAIEAVRPQTGQRDAQVAERVVATASIPNLKKEINRKLKELDDEVEGLVDDEAFAATYFITRRINDRRGRGEAAEKKEGVN
jgi:hypothetical protein